VSRRSPVEWGGGMAFAVRKDWGRDLGPLGYEPFQEDIKGATGGKSVPRRERKRERASWGQRRDRQRGWAVVGNIHSTILVAIAAAVGDETAHRALEHTATLGHRHRRRGHIHQEVAARPPTQPAHILSYTVVHPASASSCLLLRNGSGPVHRTTPRDRAPARGLQGRCTQRPVSLRPYNMGNDRPGHASRARSSSSLARPPPRRRVPPAASANSKLLPFRFIDPPRSPQLQTRLRRHDQRVAQDQHPNCT